ncbi:testis-expressed protein 9 isoform X2 [Myripristis murdjan]|uniref:testis-expressed protein 9 isoform X2 n=1 Tax=Myripristis murdjan TaxID=586833 RepID=UPI001176171F|nr:testis-expressed protein 9 isoform X2 [Myripristis murdjan]
MCPSVRSAVRDSFHSETGGSVSVPNITAKRRRLFSLFLPTGPHSGQTLLVCTNINKLLCNSTTSPWSPVTSKVTTMAEKTLGKKPLPGVLEVGLAKKAASRQTKVADQEHTMMNKPKKPLSSGGERSNRPEGRPMDKPVSGPPKKPTVDLSAQEEQYKLMNAELEAKTAELVRQAEQLMREQNEVFSKPISANLVIDIEDEEDDSRMTKPEQSATQQPGVKVVTKKRVTSSASHNTCTGKQRKEQPLSCRTQTPKSPLAVDAAVVDNSVDCSLANAIRSIEEKLDDPASHEDVVDEMSSTGATAGSAAQIRILKAKLRVMQEELDRLSYECCKKDEENSKLCTKIKEIEDDRARLQKTTNIQQTQIEKHQTLAEESARRCDGLQLQVAGLQKEIQGLNRAQKQAAGNHSTVEVRLNRALEEVERLKTQLSKTKQMSKDKMNEEHQNTENLLAENKMLKKQKAELIVGFKKQLKLIDILKRQKVNAF